MKNILLLLFSLVIMSFLNGQNQLVSLYNNQNYTQCLEEAEKILAQNEKDATSWQYKALSLMQMGKYESSISAFNNAKENGYQPSVAVDLNKAKSLAQLDKSQALDLLDSLNQSGLSLNQPLEDPLFDPLAEDKNFLAIKKEVWKRAFPCYSDSNYTKMDFWCGEWDVFVNGRKIGENSITKQEGGCMILEQYTTPRDFVGQSINFYDIDDKKWKQIWIDHTTNITKYIEIESKPSGYIKFLAQPSTSSSNFLQMTFTLNEDESVTQLIEQSPDGKEWTTAFNGKYVKKNVK